MLTRIGDKNVKTKNLTVAIEKAAPDTGDGVWVISSKNPDRVGDTIDPAALRKNADKKIPALFGHDHSQIVGYWEVGKEKGGKLLATLKLAGTDLGRMIKTLLDDGVPLSASIGFTGKGVPIEGGGWHYKELDIFETSIVAVPCNAEAVRVKAMALGLNPEPLFVPEQSLTLGQKVALHRAAAALEKSKSIIPT